jgi:membrane protein implicated in regulation of membrane protease activity
MVEPWFVWALAGFVCIGLEMLLPGFVIFFFGMGGLLTAVSCLVPFVSGQVWLQVLLFVAFSVGSLVFLRQKFTRIFAGTIFDSNRGNVDSDGVGDIADVLETAGTVTEGRIRFRGTTWKAHTREGECATGSRVRIVAREGMTYIVEAVKGGEENTAKNGGNSK